jgi:TetR/AcrR family transcriptional regulator, ethionamide resistance regulator
VPVDTRRVRLRAERGANRAAIVAAAEAALRERPFREVSVEELMQRAGLARTQFYRYFDDLSDLVLGVAAAVFEDVIDRHERLVDIARLDADTLREAITPAVAAFAEHGPLVRALSEAATHDEVVERAYEHAQQRYIAITERLVHRAVDAGARVADPAQTARLLHLANIAYLIDTFGGEPKVTPEVAVDTIVEMWSASLGLAAHGTIRPRDS